MLLRVVAREVAGALVAEATGPTPIVRRLFSIARAMRFTKSLAE
jgi:hypothetical protein